MVNSIYKTWLLIAVGVLAIFFQLMPYARDTYAIAYQSFYYKIISSLLLPDVTAIIVLSITFMRGFKAPLLLFLFLGYALDALHGIYFGIHSLAMLVGCCILLKYHLQIRCFSIWQQLVILSSISLISDILILFLASNINVLQLLLLYVMHILIWFVIMRGVDQADVNKTY